MNKNGILMLKGGDKFCLGNDGPSCVWTGLPKGYLSPPKEVRPP